MVKLGDVFTVARGGSPRPIDSFITEDPDGLNWIMIGDTKGVTKYIESTAKKIKPEGLKKTREVFPGDFLLSNSMSFGKPYILKVQGCIHDGWLVLSPKENQVDTDYFYHYLSSTEIKNKLASKAAGAVVKNLNSEIVRQLEILLPPLEEQKRIAVILDKADAIRRKRQQAIELADEFLRSVFLDMFGDPVVNPKGWEVQSCSDICRQITVGLVIRPASYYVESGVPAIRSLNVTTKGIKQENFVYFSQEDNVGTLSKSRVYEGDLVVVRSGQPGKAAVIPKELDGINAIDVLIVRPKQEVILSDFLAFFMNSSAGKNLVMKEERGQIQKHLNVGSLNQAEIPVPPIDLQNKFVSIIKTIRRLETTPSLREGENFFNSLSQKAFSGEL
jgi:type I restriction enzyme S subunit